MRASSAWTALILLFIKGATRASTVKKPGSSTGRFANATLVRLSEFLSAGYKKGVRPVKDWRTSTIVAIDLMVYSILNVDEKNQVLTTYVWYRQSWTDEFLVWNPEDFDEVKQVSLPTANVWVPDILINEFVDVGKSPDIPYVYVTHDGLVRNYKPIQVVTACTLNIYNFPFDVQKCSLTFQSWLHTIDDINITLMRSPEELREDKSVFMNQGEWELLHILSNYKIFSVDNDDYYAEMKFHVSVYFVVCMALLVISLTETVLIVRLVHKQDLQPPVPPWLKYLILERAPVLFCIHRKPRLCSNLTSQPPDLELYKESSYGTAQCPLHHTCELGRRRSHLDREGGGSLEGVLLGLGRPLPRDPTPPVMDNILQEVTAIRHFLEKRDRCREVAKEWLQVGYVLDVLLFRVYLVAVVAYSITLGTLWHNIDFSDNMENLQH
ncbi:5-hydroxytryptamine receptor 3A [Dissostichus eleginoides]|uniref:5-hydroxytryptamine receptor 3A n=1 Tax=Dissostichus eleginoides TaxID=100907 RepID=A0AAD9BGX8_DISEL|nr:5-hydroxytryptamine receptor 3A [Dissostichus eleginoides]